jgi:holo-[acyl-carrier protein] synthase
MIEKLGIGIDIIEINRFQEKLFKNNENFYQKIFHDSEIDYCLNQKNPYPSFATKFAIKESVIKSVKKSVSFLDIMTSHENSKPIAYLMNDSSYNFLVTVSHEKLYAVAVVIAEIQD